MDDGGYREVRGRGVEWRGEGKFDGLVLEVCFND